MYKDLPNPIRLCELGVMYSNNVGSSAQREVRPTGMDVTHPTNHFRAPPFKFSRYIGSTVVSKERCYSLGKARGGN
jgi:hypothetical protein